ncbi:hypothetical protein OR62_03940 [Clostridium tetani]|uniref:Uncharacterized protein n=1 Tax=Clostridium tetani TaxID=1513 RepID=A0ABY0EQT0_CLOTA|nr:hypothetical protein OR62_03940 [Clostridium tetani]RXI54169.1 hypothetical protein DP131_10055 [Clostridium tetani]RXI68831.1 hypothetical protein DQN76_08415 [Clostridium tetani]
MLRVTTLVDLHNPIELKIPNKKTSPYKGRLLFAVPPNLIDTNPLYTLINVRDPAQPTKNLIFFQPAIQE